MGRRGEPAARAEARTLDRAHRRRSHRDRRRRGHRRGVDEPRRRVARIHDDVALPLRHEQGRPDPAHAGGRGPAARARRVGRARLARRRHGLGARDARRVPRAPLARRHPDLRRADHAQQPAHRRLVPARGALTPLQRRREDVDPPAADELRARHRGAGAGHRCRGRSSRRSRGCDRCELLRGARRARHPRAVPLPESAPRGRRLRRGTRHRLRGHRRRLLVRPGTHPRRHRVPRRPGRVRRRRRRRRAAATGARTPRDKQVREAAKARREAEKALREAQKREREAIKHALEREKIALERERNAREKAERAK